MPSIEVTLDRATVWRSRSKPGRIKAYGTFRGVGGPFDMTQIVVTVTDGQDLDELGEFSSCRTSPSGAIHCQNDDRTARIRYIPDRLDPTLYRYELEYRRRDITAPQVPPLEIRFVLAGGPGGAARNEPCRVRNAKLVCNGESAPACDPTPEICDGVDNDCNGRIDDDGLGQDDSGVDFSAYPVGTAADDLSGPCVTFDVTTGSAGIADIGSSLDLMVNAETNTLPSTLEIDLGRTGKSISFGYFTFGNCGFPINRVRLFLGGSLKDDLTIDSCAMGTYTRTMDFDQVVIDAGRITNVEAFVFQDFISLTY